MEKLKHKTFEKKWFKNDEYYISAHVLENGKIFSSVYNNNGIIQAIQKEMRVDKSYIEISELEFLRLFNKN